VPASRIWRKQNLVRLTDQDSNEHMIKRDEIHAVGYTAYDLGHVVCTFAECPVPALVAIFELS